MSGFFVSRWIEVPGNLAERAGELPRGFRAAGVAAGPRTFSASESAS